MRQVVRASVLVTVLVAALAADTLGESKMKVTIPPAEELLARVVKEHPRVLARAADFAATLERFLGRDGDRGIVP